MVGPKERSKKVGHARGYRSLAAFWGDGSPLVELAGGKMLQIPAVTSSPLRENGLCNGMKFYPVTGFKGGLIIL